VGALLGYHYTNSAIPRLLDLENDAEAIERRSASNRWFWGNVSQPFEKNFRADPDGEGFIINGVKAWNTGPSLADVTSVLAPRSDRRELLYAVIPTDREGLIYHKDWDHLGLRLTDTVTITFKDVKVYPDEVAHSSHAEPILSFPPYYGPLGELIFAADYLGWTLGAIEAARDYTRTKTRPPIPSGLESATQDPFILQDYGDFWSKVQAGQAYLLQVAAEVQEGFERRRTITSAE
jgi:alkylation response protein AidB-like acyl-CoA dehydrogenase